MEEGSEPMQWLHDTGGWDTPALSPHRTLVPSTVWESEDPVQFLAACFGKCMLPAM